MKKKVISLLLVAVLLTGIMSVGFSSVVADASSAGKGIEAINAFSLVDSKESGAGTTYSSKITIKSKSTAYQIKVKSLSAFLPFYGSTETRNFSVTYTNGTVCTSSGVTFNVSGTLDAARGSVIRYTCLYDLLNSAGQTIYTDMTGYGYGYAGGSSAVSGARGGANGNPGKRDTDCTVNSIAQLNTCYVQQASLSLGYETRTAAHDNGGSNLPGVTAGNAPSTMSFSYINWTNRGSQSDSGTSSGTWCTMTTPASGFYSFTVSLNANGDRWDDTSNTITNCTMYYRSDSNKNSALSYANTYLNYGLEKSYYTAASWNNYLAQMDYAQSAGRAIAFNNYGYQVACAYASNAASASGLSSTKNSLVQTGADYTYFNLAKNTFNTKKATSVSVFTYTAGQTSCGTTTTPRYSADSINAVQNYINSCSTSLYACDQLTVNAYTDQITALTNSMTDATAVFTYIDRAISEYSTYDSSVYSLDSWNAYTSRVTAGQGLSRSLPTGSQSTVNNALDRIVEAKNALAYAPANYTKLNQQLSTAEMLIAENGTSGTEGTLATGADGFQEVWDAFIAAYNTAITASTYTMDRQADVDNAATALQTAISDLNPYRYLDTTDLAKAAGLSPAYAKAYYESSSYSTWNSLRVEGFMFLTYADPSYVGDNKKTYEDYDDMVWLTQLITSAYNNLELVKADFTNVSAAVALVPDDAELMLYQDLYVNIIKDLLASIDYGATFLEQEDVDAIAVDIENAVGELTPEHYKDADYAEVDTAIATANGIDQSLYESFSGVTDAISAVDRTKKIVDQAEVDAMAQAIYDAIDALIYLPANYADVDAAIAEANAIEHPENYKNFSNITDAINAVDRTKPIVDQAVVDGYATTIRQAIADLFLDDADYTGIHEAIAAADALAPLSDFTDDSVANLDSKINAVVEGYTKDRQAEVDAMEQAIYQAIDDMVLLPANFSTANTAIDFVNNTVVRENFTDLSELDAAIAGIDWTLNCRQQDILATQVDAIYTAVNNLSLKNADYAAVDKAITDARYAYNNGEYEYSQVTIDAVEAAITAVDRTKKITEQATVDGYKTAIDEAVAGLTYIDADYSAVNEAVAKFNALDRSMYLTLSALDSAVASVVRGYKIDRQAEVTAMAEAINTELGKLDYGPADYTAVDNAIAVYDSLNRSYYVSSDITASDLAVAAVVRGYTIDRQGEVDTMADNINDALRILATKIKSASTTALDNAVTTAKAKLLEMANSGYVIDVTTSGPVYSLIEEAEGYQGAKISAQNEIDELTQQIIEATEALQYVFNVDLSESGLIVSGDTIYGFEEGTISSDVESMISFVGDAELVIQETRNGFGTGTVIKFVNSEGKILLAYTVIVFGDANGDAVIDMFDVAYCAEVANTGVTVPDAVRKAIDLDGDGYVDTIDTAIMISLANMDNTISQDGLLTVF